MGEQRSDVEDVNAAACLMSQASRTLLLAHITRIPDFGSRTTDHGSRIPDFGSRTSDHGTRISDF